MTEFEKLRENWLDFEQFKQQFQKVPIEEYPNNVLNEIPDPKVSVRITTYQHLDYIRNTIDNVLMQKTDFPFEIILGDDDSTDGTREICIEYAKKHPDKIRLFLHKRENNIKVLERPTGIFQIAYNTMQCRGEYIAGCSGDDYWQDESKLQKQVDFMEKSPDVAFTYHDHSKLFVESGEIKGPYAVDRTQTIMGKNIFNKLPKEFFNIMQEDSFFKFFWRHTGKAVYVSNIRPAIVRYHKEAMYTSLSEEKTLEQRINLWNNIIAACHNSNKISKEAKNKLTKVIIHYYKNNDKLNSAQKISFILRDLKTFGLLFNGMNYLSSVGLKKFSKEKNSRKKPLVSN